MFTSNTSVCGNNATLYTDWPSINDVSHNSKLDLPLSFFDFPPTFLDYNDDHHELLVGHLLPQQQFFTTNTSSTAATPIDTMFSNKTSPKQLNRNYSAGIGGGGGSTDKQIAGKRSAKIDRHSKIFTAQGPRDRRMRLSVEIARQFFDLQDMLGFDKASKTIEWLLTKSKAAIKELATSLLQTNASSSSECEVRSGVETAIALKKKSLAKEKKTRQLPKAAFYLVARESRKKARARARERTIEKIRSRRLDQSKQCLAEGSPHMIMSSSPIEAGEESRASHMQEMKSSVEVVVEHQGPTKGTVVESLVTTSKSSPSSIFNFQEDIAISQGVISNNNSFPNFLENWDIDGARAHTSYCGMSNPHQATGNVQEQIPSSIFLTTSDIRLLSQFADMQFLSKLGETYNN